MVARLKKILLSISIIIILFFLAGYQLINTKNEFLVNFKRLFPQDIKYFLKKNFFIIPDLKKQISELNEKNSSLEKIISEAEKKNNIANEVVFPEAVPPTNNMDMPYCIASQKKAICIEENVLNSSKSTGVNGSSLNRRIVNVEPLVETSLPRVITIREPSINVASRSGSAIEICFPHR